jgi:hypothetical protein
MKMKIVSFYKTKKVSFRLKSKHLTSRVIIKIKATPQKGTPNIIVFSLINSKFQLPKKNNPKPI